VRLETQREKEMEEAKRIRDQLCKCSETAERGHKRDEVRFWRRGLGMNVLA